MNESTAAQCATAVSLFRGLYARVAHKLGVDVSYVSRIARGERKSKVAERALTMEFNKVLGLLRNNLSQAGKYTDGQTRKNIRQNRLIRAGQHSGGKC
jgi:hypothetical protein